MKEKFFGSGENTNSNSLAKKGIASAALAGVLLAPAACGLMKHKTEEGFDIVSGSDCYDRVMESSQSAIFPTYDITDSSQEINSYGHAEPEIANVIVDKAEELATDTEEGEITPDQEMELYSSMYDSIDSLGIKPDKWKDDQRYSIYLAATPRDESMPIVGENYYLNDNASFCVYTVDTTPQQ